MRGIKEAYDILKKSSSILVYFDPDIDGLMAGFKACSYLEKHGYKYSYYINPNRQHGFFLTLGDIKGLTIIAVDFAITRSEIIDICNAGANIINIDHHETEDEFVHVKTNNSCEGVIINNQYPFEPEELRFLSGAGVVYYVMSEWDSSFDTKENRAVVGITLLSDIRPLENPIAKKFLKDAYTSDTEHGYIGYLVNQTKGGDYTFGAPKMDRNFIDFTFSPKINAMLRFGYEWDALKFTLGGGMLLEDMRKEQTNVIDKMIEISSITRLSSLNVVMLEVNDYNYSTQVELTNFIGLLCSRIKGVGTSTIAIVLNNGVVRRASFRGKYDSIDYLSAVRELGYKVAGHKGAFGWSGFTPSDSLWVTVNSIVEKLEAGYKPTTIIKDVNNLSLFITNSGYSSAEHNVYVRDAFRIYVNYTGKNIKKTRGSDRYVEYCIDGKTVKSFDTNLSPTEGYILPTLEKGYVTLYLRQKF